jgi:hypothetical protein
MRHHLVGCMMHMCQICILIFYVDFIYINNKLCESVIKDDGTYEMICGDNPYAIILLGGIIYPFMYECIQIVKRGFTVYIKEANAIVDILYIFGSIAMSISHLVNDPFNIASKIIMIAVIMLSITRTFKFMRIFSSFSPIVTMLNQVVIDLQQFMFFYTILIFLFSILWSAIGLGNKNKNINKVFHDEFANAESDYPGVEYKVIGLFIGNVIDVLRTTLGDYNCISTSMFLDRNQTFIFWISWIIVVIVGCIIFLNFIIAEASASYEKVSERLDEFIAKEKANLISESEGMTPDAFKSMHNYPKYIIIRQVDQ